MKRIITEQEERAIRLCHHDFGGLTQKDAARLMGKTRQRVQQLLQSAEQKILSLFPILTKRQVEVRDYINKSGLTYEQIAKILNVSKSNVGNIVETLKKKKVYLEKREPVRKYELWMDSQIVQKF